VGKKVDGYLERVRELLGKVQLHEPLQDSPIRVDVDQSREWLARKVRDGEVKKILVLLICGSRDEQAQSVTLRHRGRMRCASDSIPG
jgi:threonyl-tRNA synthetase